MSDSTNQSDDNKVFILPGNKVACAIDSSSGQFIPYYCKSIKAGQLGTVVASQTSIEIVVNEVSYTATICTLTMTYTTNWHTGNQLPFVLVTQDQLRDAGMPEQTVFIGDPPRIIIWAQQLNESQSLGTQYVASWQLTDNAGPPYDMVKFKQPLVRYEPTQYWQTEDDAVTIYCDVDPSTPSWMPMYSIGAGVAGKFAAPVRNAETGTQVKPFLDFPGPIQFIKSVTPNISGAKSVTLHLQCTHYPALGSPEDYPQIQWETFSAAVEIKCVGLKVTATITKWPGNNIPQGYNGRASMFGELKGQYCTNQLDTTDWWPEARDLYTETKRNSTKYYKIQDLAAEYLGYPELYDQWWFIGDHPQGVYFRIHIYCTAAGCVIDTAYQPDLLAMVPKQSISLSGTTGYFTDIE